MVRRTPFALLLALVVSACGGTATTTTSQVVDAADPPSLEEQLVERLSEERWDADCLSLLDEAIGLAQGVVDEANPLTTEELAGQSATITADFDPLQADLAERFNQLECSQFWWDVTLVERSEDLTSTSVAGFITKFGFLETSVANIAREYGPAVGLMVDVTPEPLPDRPPTPQPGSCDDVFDALLAFQVYQVDLADHLVSLPATPPDDYEAFAAGYAAATAGFADENGCDTIEAAEHIIANEQ